MQKFLFMLLCIIVQGYVLAQDNKPEVLLRIDDVGMNHAVNMAIDDLGKTGLKFSASVMFACPWYQEAVAILKQHKQVDVGVHLTLTSEWQYYRWGPVTGPSGVPSLVDSVGYFYVNEDQFLKSGYKLDEVEKELTAQIDRAMKSGLKISYIDPHMGVALSTAELKQLTEKLAKKYNLGISTLGSGTYYNEVYKDMWAVPVADKKQVFLNHLNTIKPGQPNLVILHVARQTPEMNVLEMESLLTKQNGKPMAGEHRQAELDMLLSPEFQEMIGLKFKLITYADLVNNAVTIRKSK